MASVLLANGSCKSRAWFVVVSCSSLVSIVSCVWLLVSVTCRLPLPSRRRLFPRQMRSLAVAGLFMFAAGYPIVYQDFYDSVGKPAGWYEEFTCNTLYSLFVTMRCICALQETHLALALLAQCARATRMLNRLNSSIWVVWALGAALGVLDKWVFKFTFVYKPDSGLCEPRRMDVLSVVTLTTCWCLSALSSAATLLKASRMGQPLHAYKQNLKRAAWYPCVTMLTYLPILVAYIRPELFHSPCWYFPMATLFEGSNGTFNTAMYCLHSHYSIKARRGHAAGSPAKAGAAEGSNTKDFATFHVDFGDVDIIDVLGDTVPVADEEPTFRSQRASWLTH